MSVAHAACSGHLPDGSIAASMGKTDITMRLVRIWVFDGILASSVAGAVDVFTAAGEPIELLRGIEGEPAG